MPGYPCNDWYFTAYFPRNIGWRLNKCQLLGTIGLKGGNFLWNASYLKGNWYFTVIFPKQILQNVNKGSNRFWYFTEYFPIFHMIFPHLWKFHVMHPIFQQEDLLKSFSTTDVETESRKMGLVLKLALLIKDLQFLPN